MRPIDITGAHLLVTSIAVSNPPWPTCPNTYLSVCMRAFFPARVRVGCFMRAQALARSLLRSRSAHHLDRDHM
jgi:hypothetical protein